MLRYDFFRAVACLVLCAVLGCAHARQEGEVVPVAAPAPRESGKVRVGEPYFDFKAPLLQGGEFHLAQLVGKHVVLLQFWGIRCVPCLEEFALLEQLHQRYAGRGLRVVGVNTDTLSTARLAEAMAERQVRPGYPLVLDAEFSAAKHYTHWLVPVSVLIGRDGIVKAVHTGYSRELDAAVENEVIEELEKR